MKNWLKIISTICTVSALAGTSGIASAVTVGGVTWDTGSPLDFSGVSAVIHQDIDSLTGEVTGYGRVTTLNGAGNTSFCSGCELTFNFGGFIPSAAGALLPSGGTAIGYTGGFLDLFVDFTPEVDPLDLAPGGYLDHTNMTAANTGSEGGANATWLSLAGHGGVGGISFVGTVSSVFAASNLTGAGLFDVVGGLAALNIDTNTLDDGNGGLADLVFSSSFSIPSGVGFLSSDGTANFSGKSTAVPEPAMLGLFGLGLLGLSTLSRKRKVK
jgi:hypothetical protein